VAARRKHLYAGYVSNGGSLNKSGRRRREAGFEPGSQLCAVEIAADQHELVSCLALEVLRSIEAMQVPPDVRSAMLSQSALRALKIAECRCERELIGIYCAVEIARLLRSRRRVVTQAQSAAFPAPNDSTPFGLFPH
jgi:hypothetical protein